MEVLFKFRTDAAEAHINMQLEENVERLKTVEKLTLLSAATTLPAVKAYLQTRIDEENGKIAAIFADVRETLLWMESRNI